MNFSFYYGANIRYLDITKTVMERCLKNNIIEIPESDEARSALFEDIAYGYHKSIFVINNDTNTVKEYPIGRKICFNVEKGFDNSLVKHKYETEFRLIPDHVLRLEKIHQMLEFKHGSLSDEYPEQLLAIKYLKSDAKVLEIGGNIGRNSCVIASILDNDKDLVVLEPSRLFSSLLIDNRNINNFKFHVERSALSNVSLIQKNWTTIPSEEILPGYTKVDTITFPELESKYQITFDTLICDCEGALYYILLNDPNILTNIKMIILENDFVNFDHKKHVDGLFSLFDLKCVYHEAGGWGPCYEYFYQVFVKI